MKFTALCLASFLLFVAYPCRAQSQDPSKDSTDSAKPASPAPSTQTDPTTEKKKPKKVWTNDEISTVKGGISVIGDSNSSPSKSGDKKPADSPAADDAHRQQIQNYRDQIAELQSQMDDIDKRIDQLKNFKAEDTSPSGGINPTQGYNMVPLEDQVKQLQDKKKQLQAKIEDLENDARKNGIESGDLR